ncbi:MAG: hypothetical protein WCA20_12200 [Candidatus Sulfotelmatobacter sp.]
MTKVSNEEKRYDFIVVGAGAAAGLLGSEIAPSFEVSEEGWLLRLPPQQFSN